MLYDILYDIILSYINARVYTYILSDIALYFVLLYNTESNQTTVYYSILYCVQSYYISFFVFLLHYVMLCYKVSDYSVLYYAILESTIRRICYYFMSSDVLSYYKTALYFVILYISMIYYIMFIIFCVTC